MITKMGKMIMAVVAISVVCFAGSLQAQEEVADDMGLGSPEMVQIDWMQKMMDGGLTMVFLAVLMMFCLVLILM